MTRRPGERPLDIPDLPNGDLDPGDLAERLDADPEQERNRTDPEQSDTQDHPA